jgi:NodT family efflux transporter outer membrane factor (OMF) lipoprotein
MMIGLRKSIAGMMALSLASCSLIPDYQRPDVQSPAHWRGGNGQEESSPAITRDWWTQFGSSELESLMLSALEHNNDLRAALHRIKQARASMRVASAAFLPSVDSSAGASWDRNDPADGKTRSENSGHAGIGISYELDLFGASRAALIAAQAGAAGSVYDRDALALVVMGDVAETYFTFASLRDRIRISENNLKNSRDLLDIIQARFDAGAISALEVSQQKTVVANSEASLASIRQQQAAAENALSILLGRAPENLGLKIENLETIALPGIAPGQPSSLLERRPDIRSAEQGLIAANADIGAARAAFFPSVNLGLDASLVASPIGDPLTKGLSLAGSLTAPIFSGGRLKGDLERARARQAELMENYRKAVLVSFQETEDALEAVKAAQQRRQAYETALAEAQKAYTLSRQLYDSGAVDFQTLLNAQDTLLSAEDRYSSVKLEALSAAIDLYKALGGGWKGTA